MRNARTIKSRIAAIDKRIGELPPLVTLTIEAPDGSLEYKALDPVDAVIVLIDAQAEEHFQDRDDGEPSPLAKFSGRIVGAEISGNYDAATSGNRAPLVAMESFEGLKRAREERAQGALC